jgi:hypothetical protein
MSWIGLTTERTIVVTHINSECYAGRICSQLTSVRHSSGSRLLNLSLAYASLIVSVEPVTRQ